MGDPLTSLQCTQYSKEEINRPQSARSTLMNDNIPSSIEFDAKKYKNYDRGTSSYLIDGNAFINFLRRQTSKTMARSKSGLVGYVNVSVSDQIAECTPWKLHRIFTTSVYNRMECMKNMQLLKQNEALTESLRDKSDQIDAYRAQISQIKQQLAEQKKEINKKTKSTRYLKKKYHRSSNNSAAEIDGSTTISSRSGHSGIPLSAHSVPHHHHKSPSPQYVQYTEESDHSHSNRDRKQRKAQNAASPSQFCRCSKTTWKKRAKTEKK